MKTYVFNNYEDMITLMSCKDVKNLIGLVKQAKLISYQSAKGIFIGAKEMYQKVCEFCVANGEADAIDTFSIEVSRMFAEVWHVPALLEMASSVYKYGKLHEDAIKVLGEYESYKQLAVSKVSGKKNIKPFEEIVDDKVTIVYNSGRLSLFRNGEEYVIFYAEDMY